MSRALLFGTPPQHSLDFVYVAEKPYDAVVIGSLKLGQLLHFDIEPVLEALSCGIPVYLYTPGLPQIPKNRSLAASAATAQRELKNWGVLFTDGTRRHLITAEEAQKMRRSGQRPASGDVLTPLAKEILQG